MLDNLARGRFDFGVGKGVRPGEFAQLGIEFEDGVPMTEESIEIILKVWTEERTSHAGRFWSFPELSLRPRDLSASASAAARGGEPAGLGGASRARAAGPWRCTSRRRRSWPGACEEYRAAHRPARRARGHRSVSARGSLLCRETYVAETAEAARVEGAVALQGSGICRPWRRPRRPPSSPTCVSRS